MREYAYECMSYSDYAFWEINNRIGSIWVGHNEPMIGHNEPIIGWEEMVKKKGNQNTFYTLL